MKQELGFTKEDILERFKKAFPPVLDARGRPNPDDPFTWFGQAATQIVSALFDLGVPMPPWLWIRDPRKPGFTRQGIFQLNPGQEHTFTFQARQQGWLVLDTIEVAPQDPLSMDRLDVKFFERGDVENNPDLFAVDPKNEPGLWKFRTKVLYDTATFTVKVKNTDAFAQAVYTAIFAGREQ